MSFQERNEVDDEDVLLPSDKRQRTDSDDSECEIEHQQPDLSEVISLLKDTESLGNITLVIFNKKAIFMYQLFLNRCLFKYKKNFSALGCCC